jgi:hypothetical protein
MTGDNDYKLHQAQPVLIEGIAVVCRAFLLLIDNDVDKDGSMRKGKLGNRE